MNSKQVGIDLIGPLPITSRGNRFIITLVDYFSKWPEAEAIPNKSAESVVQYLLDLAVSKWSLVTKAVNL